MKEYVIKKDGKFMGAGSSWPHDGTAWFDKVCGDVVKGSKEMMQVQLKHLRSRTDMNGAEVVRV